MDKKKLKKGITLGALFFLPVIFLLFLYPSTNNYNPLDVVKNNVLDFQNLSSSTTDLQLENHITVLGFLGKDPESKVVETSNLKELIYDKFQGFKKFQVINKVYIVDKELNQRGRLDNRTKKEIEQGKQAYPLTAYNASEVAQLKNVMGADDLRVLFTEYRQKRKGEFNSTSRRADDLKGDTN